MSDATLEQFATAHAGFDARSVDGGTSACVLSGQPMVIGFRRRSL